MESNFKISAGKLKYLKLLSEKYPTTEAVSREIINLNAILNLPKGTEHFMSDIHGEYEAFYHILNNCSGVIREKVDIIFADTRSSRNRNNLCSLIYYPKEKLKMLSKRGALTREFYRNVIKDLIKLASFLSSKYTRSRVRKALPEDYEYIIDELLHAPEGEDNNQQLYHQKIIETIIDIDESDEFICNLCTLIKRLAVDHLHIVGDLYDRGERSDEIMDMLMDHHSLDIEWGNHDVLWMGAAAGSAVCISCVLQINIKYNNLSMLENGYGIPLRSLTLFAQKQYPGMSTKKAVVHAINVIRLKLEGMAIKRNPEFKMDDRLLFDMMSPDKKTVTIDGKVYKLKDLDYSSVDAENPYSLTDGEREVMDELVNSFKSSAKLQQHIKFMYEKGSIYKCYNQNLLFHGCIPLNEEGGFEEMEFGGKTYSGKSWLDYTDTRARRAYFGDRNQKDLDFMWYLWGGKKSPLCGRNIKTFERTFMDYEELKTEDKDPYYTFYNSEETAIMILKEFGLESPLSHIINGHTPVKVGKGETPIKANGRVLVIDGGFSKAYQKTTGIAGYTLIYNSRGMRLKDHRPFESIEKVIEENKDIESNSNTFENEPFRVMVADTDQGKVMKENIRDLKLLLRAYREGILTPKVRN